VYQLPVTFQMDGIISLATSKQFEITTVAKDGHCVSD